MDRKDFGKLVAALRQDLEWTQQQLADYGNLDVAIISQIERGVKRTIKPELRVRLANAFQLTTVERRRFLFAASGMGTEYILPQPRSALGGEAASPEAILKRISGVIERMRMPAFLIDGYSDILAANLIAHKFFEVPPGMLENAATVPGGYNTIRLVFGKELALRLHFLAEWDEYARNSMSAFREQTIYYRAHPYFQYLINAFRDPAEYPLFDRFWKMVSSMEEDREANFQIFTIKHDSFGPIKYIASSSLTVTRYGELVLVQHLPANENTRRIIDRLAKENGEGVLTLAPWPDKKFPAVRGASMRSHASKTG